MKDVLISLATVLLLIAISKWCDRHHFKRSEQTFDTKGNRP